MSPSCLQSDRFKMGRLRHLKISKSQFLQDFKKIFLISICVSDGGLNIWFSIFFFCKFCVVYGDFPIIGSFDRPILNRLPCMKMAILRLHGRLRTDFTLRYHAMDGNPVLTQKLCPQKLQLQEKALITTASETAFTAHAPQRYLEYRPLLFYLFYPLKMTSKT